MKKLLTRFKDRSDKFGGVGGENWEGVYSSYVNSASQWGVLQHTALRNIDNIPAGEARTYSKQNVQANLNLFRCGEDVNKFTLDTFRWK